MDDFEDDELYDDYEYEDGGQEYESESLKDKYDRAKEYKEKYDKLKEKYGNKSANNTVGNAGKNAVKKGSKEGTKRASKEGAKQVGKETAKQGSKEVAKQAGKESGKQVAKQAGKAAAKEGAKVAAEGAAASTGVGVVVAAAIEAADKLNELKKKVDKKTDAAIEEATGVKNFSKKKKLIPLLLIIAIIMLLFIVPAMAMYSVSETATSELTTLVRAREENNGGKKLILFTKSEFNELLKKDKDVSEDIAKKLADEGYTLEKNDDGTYKSVSYKNILKNYGSDLTTVFMPNDLTGATDGTEELLEDGETYDSLKQQDKDVAVSLNNVKKYLMAEIDNFNDGVKWQTTDLSVGYSYAEYQKFNSYSAYKNDPNKMVSDGSGYLVSETINDKNYTVKDDNNKDTMLKMPSLKSYNVDVESQGGENKAARTMVDMIEPYMQKWIIPYTIYIDTQDDDFVDSIMDNMYHPVEVSLFRLKRLAKTTKYEYYMMCHKYKEVVVESCDDKGNCTTTTTTYPPHMTGINTKDHPTGVKTLSSRATKSGSVTTYEITAVDEPYVIATDSSGDPLVKQVAVSRKEVSAPTQPELTYAGSFYEVIDREYNIVPINEGNQPNSTDEGDITITGRGIGEQTVNEYWDERLELVSSEVDDYKVSYYTEEQMEDLGRKISRIEWYQDTLGVDIGGIGGILGFGTNKFDQAYNGTYKETIERIWDGLRSWGYTEIQAAAILGNIGQESGYYTKAYDGGQAIGLCQWDDRSVDLKRFANSQGKSWEDLDIQIQFLCMETDWNARYLPHAKYQWTPGYDETFRTGTLEEATLAFRKGWERCLPSAARDDVRLACAKAAYEKLSGREIEYPIEKIEASSTTSGTTSSSTSTGVIGGGTTKYSYDDMYFAYYQIEQWYQKTGATLNSSNLQIVNLPEGGFGWPLSTTGDTAKIYRMYGSAYGYSGNHDGIDIYNGSNKMYDSDEELTIGTDVYATHSGNVYKIKQVSDESSYAYIEIKTEDGNFKTHYGCLSVISVNEGDPVTKGQKIGKVGKTGAHADDTELYLHYKMYYKGSVVDPLQYYVIQDASGNQVDNYDEIDKATVTYNTYSYKSSRLYLMGDSFTEDGDISQGYSGVFHSSSGRTYIEYVQDKGPWASQYISCISAYMGNSGCWVTASATVVSGYGHPEITPTDGVNLSNTWQLVAKYTNTDIETVSNLSKDKQIILDHLLGGNAVMFYSLKPPAFKSWKQHCMAMLDVRQNGSKVEVYVSTVNTGLKSGWYDFDQACKGMYHYWLVNPK